VQLFSVVLLLKFLHALLHSFFTPHFHLLHYSYPTHSPTPLFTNLTLPYSTHPSLHLHQPSLHPTPHIPYSIFTNLTLPYSTHPSLHLHQPSLHPTPHIPHSIFTNLHSTLLHTFPTPLSPLLPHSQTHSKISLLKTTQISSTSTPYGSS
jgi:hypothetical protein